MVKQTWNVSANSRSGEPLRSWLVDTPARPADETIAAQMTAEQEAHALITRGCPYRPRIRSHSPDSLPTVRPVGISLSWRSCPSRPSILSSPRSSATRSGGCDIGERCPSCLDEEAAATFAPRETGVPSLIVAARARGMSAILRVLTVPRECPAARRWLVTQR